MTVVLRARRWLISSSDSMEEPPHSASIRRGRSTWERCSACAKVHGPTGQLYTRCLAAFPPSDTFVRPIPVAIPAEASGLRSPPPPPNAVRRQRSPSPDADSDDRDGIDGNGSVGGSNGSAGGSGGSSSESVAESGDLGDGDDSSEEEIAPPRAAVAIEEVVEHPAIAMVHPIAAPSFVVGVHSTTKNTTQLWNVVSSVNSEIAAPLAVPTINSKFR